MKLFLHSRRALCQTVSDAERESNEWTHEEEGSSSSSDPRLAPPQGQRNPEGAVQGRSQHQHGVQRQAARLLGSSHVSGSSVPRPAGPETESAEPDGSSAAQQGPDMYSNFKKGCQSKYDKHNPGQGTASECWHTQGSQERESVHYKCHRGATGSWVPSQGINTKSRMLHENWHQLSQGQPCGSIQTAGRIQAAHSDPARRLCPGQERSHAGLCAKTVQEG